MRTLCSSMQLFERKVGRVLGENPKAQFELNFLKANVVVVLFLMKDSGKSRTGVVRFIFLEWKGR